MESHNQRLEGLSRRAFLGGVARTGAAALALPVMTSLGAVVLTGCGDSDDDSGSSGSSTVFTLDAAGVGPHTHTFSVPDATLATPPAAGFTTATSSTSGHSHSITLTQADLTNIAANMAVAANTTIVSAHGHAFTFP